MGEDRNTPELEIVSLESSETEQQREQCDWQNWWETPKNCERTMLTDTHKLQKEKEKRKRKEKTEEIFETKLIISPN